MGAWKCRPDRNSQSQAGHDDLPIVLESPRGGTALPLTAADVIRCLRLPISPMQIILPVLLADQPQMHQSLIHALHRTQPRNEARLEAQGG